MGEDALHVNFSDTQAYLVVTAEHAATIREAGYICRWRDAVPGHVERAQAVEGMLKHKADKGRMSKVLEVYGVPEEWIKKSKEGGGCRIETTDRKDGKPWLKPKYLRKGCALERDASDYLGKGCMFCGSEDFLDKTMRGKIGEATFIGHAYLCSPCTRPECVKQMEARTKRLKEGPTMTLYHKTTREIAHSIKQNGGKMVRGDYFKKEGAAAYGGIYAGHTVRECSWKYEAAGEETTTLKLKCKMGNAMQCPSEYRPEGVASGEMLKHLLNHPDGPYDSVILDRAAKGEKAPTFPVPPPPVPRTRVEDVPVGGALHPGYEFVFYTWEQIEVIEEVDDDPAPPGYKTEKRPDGVVVRKS